MGLGLDSPSHWVIIAALALLLFGYKKLPDMARSAGKSLRIFKTEMKGMADDDDARSAARGTGSAAEATPVRPVEAAAPPAPVTPTAPAATSATTVDPPAAELPGPHGEIPVAQAPAPVTTAAVAPHEAGTESAPPRPV